MDFQNLLAQFDEWVRTTAELIAVHQESIRNLSLGVVLPLVLVFALYLLWRRRVSQRADSALRTDRQITEAVADSIQKLASGELETRLGSVYTLQKLCQQYPDQHWKIVEVLTAFVRRSTAFRITDEQLSELKRFSSGGVDAPKSNILLPDFGSEYRASSAPAALGGSHFPDTMMLMPGAFAVPADVQAALNAIGRRNSKLDPPDARIKLRSCNLSFYDLTRFNLMNADLTRSCFNHAQMADVSLEFADCEGCDFFGADLSRARMLRTNAAECRFDYANLSHAAMMEGRFTRTTFASAHLEHADFEGSDLYEANLAGASLKRTNLLNTFCIRAQFGIININADETMISKKEMFVGYVDPRSAFGFAFVFPEDFFDRQPYERPVVFLEVSRKEVQELERTVARALNASLPVDTAAKIWRDPRPHPQRRKTYLLPITQPAVWMALPMRYKRQAITFRDAYQRGWFEEIRV
jgi:uncharacterized protein YjbI with pentapeptide repeats